MMVGIEEIDLRHKSRRLQNQARQCLIRDTVLSKGIGDVFYGVKTADGIWILLDGFKRYNAAIGVGISSVPIESLAEEESEGISIFVRRSLQHGLNILEQAAFIHYLEDIYKMTTRQIAARLEVSQGWVSMRRRLFLEIGESIRQKLFSGEFPVYSYMYHLSRFIRMNEASQEEVEKFVDKISGKHLSIREIEKLAYGYFKGPEGFRQWIDEGNINWALKKSVQLFQSEQVSFSEKEVSVIRDLEFLHQCMNRLERNLQEDISQSGSFFAQADLLIGHITDNFSNFRKALEEFHDRSRIQGGDSPTLRERDGNTRDCTAASVKSEHGKEVYFTAE